MPRWLLWTGLGLAVLALLLWASTAHAQVVPDMIEQYRAQTGLVKARAVRAASTLYLALFALELIVCGIGWASEKAGPEEILKELGIKVALTCFVWWVILHPDLLLDPVVNGIKQAGADITGQSVKNPLEIMNDGFRIAGKLLLTKGAPVNENVMPEGFWDQMAWSFSSLLNLLTYVFQAIPAAVLVLVCMFAIQVSFIVIAAQLQLAEIQAMIVLAAGAWFMGFAGFRITAGLAEAYIRYSIQVAIQLFFIEVVVGLGLMMSSEWETTIAYAMRPTRAWAIPFLAYLDVNTGLILQVTGSVLIFCYLAWKIPSTVAGRLTGDIQIGLTRALWGK